MQALKPDIDVAKSQAYEGLGDSRRAQVGALFWSVTIEVTVTQTTCVGRGHAVVASTGPVPRLDSVIVVDATGRSETPLEVKTLAVAPASHSIVLTGQSQLVTYTQPI